MSWSGTEPGGPGVAAYNVYVSDNGGPFTLWQSATTQTSASFTGLVGHTYGFFSVATDPLGFMQATPTSAQATTMVINPAPPPPPPPPPPTLVRLAGVVEKTNKKHQVTEVVVAFSGAVNAGEAQSLFTYRLATPGKKGSYTAKNAGIIKLKSASYNAASKTVTLIPKKPFALTKPVQLLIDGVPPSGLQDNSGRYIDGDHNGTAGGNAVAVITRSSVTIDARELSAVRRRADYDETCPDRRLAGDEVLGTRYVISPFTCCALHDLGIRRLDCDHTVYQVLTELNSMVIPSLVIGHEKDEKAFRSGPSIPRFSTIAALPVAASFSIGRSRPAWAIFDSFMSSFTSIISPPPNAGLIIG